MFTLNHFIWLALCALGISAGMVLALKKGISSKTAGLCMCAICAFSETVKIFTHMLPSPMGGYAMDPTALPFHLCSMQIYVVVFITFSAPSPKRDAVISFFVPTALLGGIMALLIPIDGVDFLDIIPYQLFVYHAALVWLALWFLITKQVDMGVKAWRRNLLMVGLMGICGMYVNGALFGYGTNFFFLTRPPMEGFPYLNLDHGWGVYFIHLASLAVILVTGLHLPFMLAERKRRQNKEDRVCV